MNRKTIITILTVAVTATIAIFLLILSALGLVATDQQIFMGQDPRQQDIVTNPATENFTGSNQAEVTINDDTYKLLVADTAQERARGLMYVEDLPENSGMLFVYPEPQPVSFWMKNTYIPLDIIYLDENLEIKQIIKNATPLSEETHPSFGNMQYAIEINGGISEQNNYSIGDQVSIEYKQTTHYLSNPYPTD